MQLSVLFLLLRCGGFRAALLFLINNKPLGPKVEKLIKTVIPVLNSLVLCLKC